LTPIGRQIGLISDERWEKFNKKLELIEQETERVKNVVIHCSDELNAMLVSRETSPLNIGIRMVELLKRPQISYEDLKPFDPERPDLPFEVFEQVEISIKYEGYLKRQEAQVAEMRRLEVKKLPEDIDYSTVTGLRLEAIEKLNKVRPENIGQASRISGVSPADISVLLIRLSN
ncbi:MAG: tRNA uridine-5-carboxymethylaminomethyl(34) synthesis enzyme MnmG, partial [Clostridia bacterium]|nr:tRNA uridine-5-carboxymethylaminomethyl(34) synthesis enzyme MnmG [Clostridia bacterium]